MPERVATYAFGPGRLEAGPAWRQTTLSLMERPLEQGLAVPLAAMNTVVPTGSLSLAALEPSEGFDFDVNARVLASALGRFRVEGSGRLRTRAGLEGPYHDVSFDASPSHAVAQRWLELEAPTGPRVVLLGTTPARHRRELEGPLRRMMESFRFS